MRKSQHRVGACRLERLIGLDESGGQGEIPAALALCLLPLEQPAVLGRLGTHPVDSQTGALGGRQPIAPLGMHRGTQCFEGLFEIDQHRGIAGHHTMQPLDAGDRLQGVIGREEQGARPGQRHTALQGPIDLGPGRTVQRFEKHGAPAAQAGGDQQGHPHADELCNGQRAPLEQHARAQAAHPAGLHGLAIGPVLLQRRRCGTMPSIPLGTIMSGPEHLHRASLLANRRAARRLPAGAAR
jgi:hypothetical protein